MILPNQSCDASRARVKLAAILSLIAIAFKLLPSEYVEAVSIAHQDDSKASHPKAEPITLEEAFLGELRPKDFIFDWLPSEKLDDKDARDQLAYEDSKNILLVTLPSIERRNGSNITSSLPKIQVSPSGLQPNVTVLVSNSSLLATIEYQGLKVSPSKRYLLIWNSRRKQFRHSSTARYFLYDIDRDMITLLSTTSTPSDVSLDELTAGEADERSRFQVVDWYSKKTPNGTIDSLILIQDNDIYNLFDVSSLSQSSDPSSSSKSPDRLTMTGQKGVLFNGVPDWLYEEEILGDTPAFQVSPQADHLAFMSFNDSHVNVMPYTIYGEQIIPYVQEIRYPKAGQPNPLVLVHVVENIHNLKKEDLWNCTQQVHLPNYLMQAQHYINRITWLTNDKLGLIWSNRNQNDSHILICSKNNNTSAWICEENLIIDTKKGWIDISDDFMPLDDNYYLALIPKYEGPDVGEFKHIAKVSLTTPESYVFLTSGHREVTMLNGIDYKRSLVYYTSTVTNEPGQRQIYVAELAATSKEPIEKSPEGSPNVSELSSIAVCVTCDHHPESCLYNYARMSPSTNYYVFGCGGPDVPRIELRATRRRRHRNFQRNSAVDPRQLKFLNDSQADPLTTDENTSNSQSSLLWVLEDNRELRDKLEVNKLLPITLRTRVPIPNTNYTANVLLLLPPLDGAPLSQQTVKTLEHYASLVPGDQKFPMVVDVYGGPGSQKVDYRFSVYFGHYMASSKRTVYAMIDGRGSGYQGTKRLFELYHRLGTVEIQDQIEVSSHLAHTLPFINPHHVAIWGWSYGGYAAAMSLAQSKRREREQLFGMAGPSMPDKREQNNQTNSTGTHTRSVFKCAASVAPVTNWIYYDTAYTEKYMSSPWANERYDKFQPGDHLSKSTSEKPAQDQAHEPGGGHLKTNKWTPLNLVTRVESNATQATIRIRADHRYPFPRVSQNIDLNERYKNASLLDQMVYTDSKHFLLMHGTADDNVNFQQSIMLMKRLIRKNILFETRLYPDQDHGIANKADKLHLGSTLSDFLDECFSETSVEVRSQ